MITNTENLLQYGFNTYLKELINNHNTTTEKILNISSEIKSQLENITTISKERPFKENIFFKLSKEITSKEIEYGKQLNDFIIESKSVFDFLCTTAKDPDLSIARSLKKKSCEIKNLIDEQFSETEIDKKEKLINNYFKELKTNPNKYNEKIELIKDIYLKIIKELNTEEEKIMLLREIYKKEHQYSFKDKASLFFFSSFSTVIYSILFKYVYKFIYINNQLSNKIDHLNRILNKMD